jgi:adenylate kinase family enzyme
VLVPREDDRESVIRERLHQYDAQTVPVLNFFRDAGVPNVEIEAGEASPEEIVDRICRSLEEMGLVDAAVKKSLVE